MKTFTIVVAADSELGIGKNGTLPWRLKEDMKHFRELTTGIGVNNAVIMGRKTWESIPVKFRPLPDRLNVVLSHFEQDYEGAIIASNLNDALQVTCDHAFVIGGGAVYKEAIKHPSCGAIVITRIDGNYSCDTFFPRYVEGFKFDSVIGRSIESSINYSIERWTRS